MTSSDDAAAAAPRAVVAGHGAFASGIISAVEQISGKGAMFVGLSNADLDAAGLEAAMRDAVAAHGARVVFTDLPAGSCTIAARRCARGRADLAVVTGANLPMLLDWAFKSGDAGATAQATAHAAARGREAIAVAVAGDGIDAH